MVVNSKLQLNQYFSLKKFHSMSLRVIAFVCPLSLSSSQSLEKQIGMNYIFKGLYHPEGYSSMGIISGHRMLSMSALISHDYCSIIIIQDNYILQKLGCDALCFPQIYSAFVLQQKYNLVSLY